MGAKAKQTRELQVETSRRGQKQIIGGRPFGALAILGSLLCVVWSLSGCALTGSGSSLRSQATALNITTSTLSPAQQQSSYQATLSASGGAAPYLWSIKSGSLPSGLSLTNATGQISGRATQTGTFNFTAQVQDSSSPLQTATKAYTIAVAQSSGSTLRVTTTSMPGGTVGSSYSQTLAATGGSSPYTWGVSTGSLPAGLSLNATTGKISGTPSQQQTSNFTVEVSDSSRNTAQAALSIVISKPNSGSSGLAVTTTSMPGATVGTAYAMTFAATGGNSPYSWGITSGSLPAGLSLNSSSGAVSGTPSQQQTSSFTVTVTDASRNTAQASLSIVVAPSSSGGGGSGSGTNIPLDQYGGREDIPCTQTLAYFHMEKISGRWWFCDPAGNAFISMSVGDVETNGNPTPNCQGQNTYPIYVAKYGDTTNNWGWATLKRMTSWGFNSIGQDSSGPVMPWQTCNNCSWPGGKQPIPLPYLTEPKPAEYASVNEFGYLTSPIKDEISGTNGNYTGWRGGALLDVFDPGLNTEFQKELANTSQPSTQLLVNNSPYLLGVFTDDSDYFTGSGAGPDFVAPGHVNANMAWITLITSPEQTYIQSTPFGGKTFLYQTTQNFSKSLATNPTTACSIQNPCSLRDYLWQKYNGSISTLNSAWGSNYTTFGSTGTAVTGEVIGSGNGATTTFHHTLAHSPLSPLSIVISVGGTSEAGDCPWFQGGCGTSVANTGSFGSPTANYIKQASSTIDYATGAVTITFAAPPANGTSITVSYTYNGWMSGGTGLMDEDGSHSWVGTNPFCLEGNDPSYPTYFACIGSGGYAVPNANPKLGADLDNWVSQMAAQYFKTMHDDLKAVTKIPYFGLDTIGSWGSPAYSKFLQGAAPYLDGAFVSLSYWAPTPSPSLFQSAYQYLTENLGDIPMINFGIINAQANSSYYCRVSTGPNNMSSQSTRGQMWYNTVQYLLSTPGHNGDVQFVGFDWWSWQDFQNINQGLVDLQDNAYDGHEDVTGAVACSNPLQGYSCGKDTGNYGDVITMVKKSNLFWFTY
jgi:hypothetical protein